MFALGQTLLPADLGVHGEERLREPAEVVHALGADRQASGHGGGIGGQRERGGALFRLVRQQLLDDERAGVGVRAVVEQQPGLAVERPLQVKVVHPAVPALSIVASHASRCAAATLSASGAAPHARCGRLASSTVRNSASLARLLSASGVMP